MNVGFIGLGAMGESMARNLVKAGHRVMVYNRTRGKADALASEGAEIAEDVRATARNDVVITMLSDDDAVAGVAFGEGKLVAEMAPASLHISMSTISVALSRRLEEAHRSAAQAYLAAPVLGRPEAAAAARLFILTAGHESAIGRAQPLFDAMGQKTFVVGGAPSNANLVKLSANFLIASIIETLGEAFALTRKAGVDPNRYLELLTETLFSAPVYKTYGGLIANERYEPAGFKMALGLKDVRLALAAADDLAAPMPVASLLHDRFLAGVAQGQGDRDWSGAAGLIAKSAGL